MVDVLGHRRCKGTGHQWWKVEREEEKKRKEESKKRGQVALDRMTDVPQLHPQPAQHTQTPIRAHTVHNGIKNKRGTTALSRSVSSRKQCQSNSVTKDPDNPTTLPITQQ